MGLLGPCGEPLAIAGLGLAEYVGPQLAARDSGYALNGWATARRNLPLPRNPVANGRRRDLASIGQAHNRLLAFALWLAKNP